MNKKRKGVGRWHLDKGLQTTNISYCRHIKIFPKYCRHIKIFLNRNTLIHLWCKCVKIKVTQNFGKVFLFPGSSKANKEIKDQQHQCLLIASSNLTTLLQIKHILKYLNLNLFTQRSTWWFIGPVFNFHAFCTLWMKWKPLQTGAVDLKFG